MRGDAYPIEQRVYLMALHEQGHTLSSLSRQCGVSREVLSRWWQRYQAKGIAGLHPHSRRPHRVRQAVTRPAERHILQLRRRGWGPARIALHVAPSRATVHRVLQRHGQSRLARPPRRPVQRYEKSHPGELLHLDVKVLPALRNARYDYEFAAVDDFSREAVAWIAPDQTSPTAAAFLERVVTTLPYSIDAVLTDNAWAFTMRHAHHGDRATRFQEVCHAAGIQHLVLRPYAPQSNGKVERFFRTVNDECLHVRRLFTFAARQRAVEHFVWFYNHERPHLSLAGQTPVQRREAYFASSSV